MGEIGEWSRFMKDRKKRQKLSHPPRPNRRRCWDWMVVSGNTHYAKNRSSFKTYKEVSGTAQRGRARVIGIGTVELTVRRSPRTNNTITLIMTDVLHMPDAPCNGFNPYRKGNMKHSVGEILQGTATIGNQNDLEVWYAKEFCGLWRLVLAGNPQGESYLEAISQNSAGLSLSVYLCPNEERSLHLQKQDTSPEPKFEFCGFSVPAEWLR